MKPKRKIGEIKLYEYNTDGRFYRAVFRGISVPAPTLKGAIERLTKDTIFELMTSQESQIKNNGKNK